MASLRQKWRVRWDDGEPVEVITSARDLATSADHQSTPGYSTFALVHAALERTGVAVPDLDTFIDVLDEIEPIGAVVNGVGPPTLPALSGGGPSTSPPSPAPTGARGSKRTTTARSSPRKKS